MLGAAARFLPAIRNFTRQIVPPVIATLIAAVLIAGYNRAFTGHLVQPRMGMLHGDIIGTDEAQRPAGVATAKPREATDAIIVAEPVSAQNRVFAKDNDREAAKDDAALKTAAPRRAAEPAPVEAARAAPAVRARAAGRARPAPRRPSRASSNGVRSSRVRTARRLSSAQPPVIVAQPPMAAPGDRAGDRRGAGRRTVSGLSDAAAGRAGAAAGDRRQADGDGAGPSARGVSAERAVSAGRPHRQPPASRSPPPPPQGGPLERFVDTMKPSSIFARMREFGDKIEAAGNDILPNIRQ